MILPCIAAVCCVLGADSSRLHLEEGDTITVVGGVQAERMQHFPYFEAAVRESLPNMDLHFRNFAWSGDEVAMQPRPYKFAGMDAHLERVGTDVLIACFGL
ncbi:MAG: azurin, partial [Phycisphaerae bacterium]|nr:azurin [Phycisphaerae bacterium]